MKIGGILFEVWQDIRTGTARIPMFTFIFVIVTSTFIITDLIQIRSYIQSANEYQAAGASITTLIAPGQISGPACESLTDLDLVKTAGAIRESEGKVTYSALPSAPLPIFEITPSFPNLLNTTTTGTSGIVASDQVLSQLGRQLGDTIATNDGEVSIAGVYSYPDDGRRSEYAYAALIPTNDSKPFDECWIDSWPQSDEIVSLLYTTLIPTKAQDVDSPSISQLNTTLAREFNGQHLFQNRITKWAPILAAAVCLIVGFMSIHIRRLHIASALHTGLLRKDMRRILALETFAWLTVGIFITLTAAFTLVMTDMPADRAILLTIMARTTLLAAIGAIAGAIFAWLTIREKQLFNYYKNR